VSPACSPATSVGNALVIGGGTATYLVLRDLANLSPIRDQRLGQSDGTVGAGGEIPRAIRRLVGAFGTTISAVIGLHSYEMV
jgi:hypothetical protein